MAFTQVVQSDDVHAGVEEDFGADASYIAGATGDQNTQMRVSFKSPGCRIG